MAYEQKDNTGSLFKNDKREKDTHPNATGSAVIDGVAYWVSAWTKETKDGAKWQSLSFQRKDAKPQAAQQPQKRGTIEDLESDIPF